MELDLPDCRELDDLVYLDCSATTPLHPEVLAAMRPYLGSCFGNPSGAYSLGRKARGALERSRGAVAAVLGCAPGEVVFTSGGSESDNLALRGTACAARRAGRGRHIVTTAVEHKAVLRTAHDLEQDLGVACTVVGVDATGRVRAADVLDAVRDDTVLVSVMLANNEVGTLQPVAEIGRALRDTPVVVHTDAVQAAAWLDLDVDALGVDLMSLSAHKFYGPKGVGVLYVRQGTVCLPQQTGGGQEGGWRAGTENVAGAVGLAAALSRVARDRDAAGARARALRDRLVERLAALDGVTPTGHPTERLPGHASFVIDGARADVLLLGLDMHGICASSASACSSGQLSPSHVLTAMGLPAEQARGALRLSLGRETTAAGIERVLDVLPPLVARLRAA